MKGTDWELDASAPVKHWMWIHPGTRRSRSDWQRVFARMREAGIDAVLPEVFAGDRVLFEYPHTLVETSAPVLETILPLAHEAGMEVHAWLWILNHPNPRIVSRHPEWYCINRLGDSAHDKPAYVPHYQFVCPRQPGVQEFMRDTVESLARIGDLDGLHFDYVRLPDVILAKGLWKKYGINQDREYPQYDYCYCDLCRSLFRERQGIDPAADMADPAAAEAWRRFRYDGVTALVNDILVPVTRGAGKQTTAAVFPNWQHVRQEWHTWHLDGFLPMLYHSFHDQDIDWIGTEIQAAYGRMQQAGNPKPVYAGLFVPSLEAGDISAAIRIAREKQARGIALFSYQAMTGDGRWQATSSALNSGDPTARP